MASELPKETVTPEIPEDPEPSSETIYPPTSSQEAVSETPVWEDEEAEAPKGPAETVEVEPLVEPPEVHVQAGDIIGRYQLEAVLGKGGMAEVWQARRLTDESRVAIKFLRPERAADPTERARLDAEMVVATRLNHPNIVHILDISDPDDARPYFVTEFVPGPSLAAFLRERKSLPLAEALPLLAQMADALDYAHTRGIVHRDIKPGNIILAPAPETGGTPLVKVLDFGIATLQGRDESLLAREGMVFGTPDFIAPEQAMGTEVDPRADQYALAALTYRILTGQPLFPRQEGEAPFNVALRHVRETPPDPRLIVPSLPLVARDALLHALAKDPADRFPSCRMFVDALRGGRTKSLTTQGHVEGRGASAWLRRLLPAIAEIAERATSSGRSSVRLVVAPDGSGDFISVAAAVTAAPSGATIYVKPGVYRENVRISRPVEIYGEPGATIAGDIAGMATVHVGITEAGESKSDREIGYRVLLSGLLILNRAPRHQNPLHSVVGGDRVALQHARPNTTVRGELRVIRCVIEARHGAAVALTSDTSHTLMDGCRLRGEELGLIIVEGRLTATGGDITSPIGTGVRITGSPGAVVLDGVTIHDCGGDGVTVETTGDTVAESEGSLVLRNCTIRDNRFCGLATEPMLLPPSILSPDASVSGIRSVQVIGGKITGNRIGVEDSMIPVQLRGVDISDNRLPETPATS